MVEKIVKFSGLSEVEAGAKLVSLQTLADMLEIDTLLILAKKCRQYGKDRINKKIRDYQHLM